MKSDKGFSYSKFILLMGCSICVMLVMTAVLTRQPSDVNHTDWTFFLIMSGIVLFLTFVSALMIPNTCTIEILENQLKVSRRQKKELIAFSNIQNIEKSTSFQNQVFKICEFYRIDLNHRSVFGNTIYFKVSSGSNSGFTKELKKHWLVQRNSSFREA